MQEKAQQQGAQQQPAQQKTTAAKSTETVRKVRGMVKAMYQGAVEAKAKGQPVAYCMVGSQYDEIVRTMGVFPIWTENYAGLCAAKRDAERFIMKAESEGYSNVICGYVRTGIGFDAMRREIGDTPPTSPDGGMVMPDLLLGSSFACDPRFKWYQALGHYMNVPSFSFDVVTPPVTTDLSEVTEYYVKYQHEQLKGLVSFLEGQTKKKLDTDRLWQAVKLGDETWRMWYEVDRLRRAIPGPMPSEDHYNAMVPGYYYCGTPEALAFYQELRDEVKARAENKVGVIPEEKYRLLFGGGLPPWHTMWMFNYFESLGAVFVIENAYRQYDPVEVPAHVKDPVEYIAWRSFLRMTQRYDKAKQRSGNPTVERLLEFINDYKIDGVVFHATRSCRATTIGQIHWKNLLQQYVDIPATQLISDIVDVRDYSEAQWKAQINAFVEAVDAHKSKKR
ncbi:MAG: 2-hydroxyacyl-CoA dehydratase family protein [Chloroflexota bacterium]